MATNAQRLKRRPPNSSCVACNKAHVKCRPATTPLPSVSASSPSSSSSDSPPNNSSRDSTNRRQPCAHCSKKGIECVPVPIIDPGVKKKRNRSGKNIENAKILFGKEFERIQEAHWNLSSSKVTVYARAEQSLGLTVDRTELKRHLLSVQTEVLKFHMPITHFWSNYDDTVVDEDTVGKCPPEEVIFSTLLVVGAWFSDHPAVIRSSPLSSLSEVWGSPSSLPFGALRASSCHTLLAQALNSCDRGGIMRLQTVESVISLLLLERV
ncbi:hypothetical protein BT69DRAFT_224850 [Atractiella rhizophila]|nr:hypothetical protein BT69DRAFT_224850 [Atractiella rhizophila]